jgi:hypothetical protein
LSKILWIGGWRGKSADEAKMHSGVAWGDIPLDMG